MERANAGLLDSWTRSAGDAKGVDSDTDCWAQTLLSPSATESPLALPPRLEPLLPSSANWRLCCSRLAGLLSR